ncbi:MAG: glutathione S-transferase family protein [Bauldia sp.]|uniref:glutathione S-transferase family protein n=1 Tax=Bauldia sp. TaxID=2575872 RepID=UPI001E14AE6B|nr:glutathione S-transferase family protein [Bauldia sp.]MCB1488444.1 glutathione S-transferase family protein [Bauldia sp.]MCB1495040.1 glutathione S-transferase family protein [Bauldia sp.]
MLTIWGGLKSNNVQKVVWAVEELGVDYDLVPAGMEHGGTRTPDFRMLNPNGLVPVIDDGGFILWESNAIVRYLGARYGDAFFYPADLQERALADRWMDWANLQFYSALRPAFQQLVRIERPRRDLGQIDESLAKTETYVAILDRHLADKEFANGAHFSMADICLAVIAHRWMGLPVDRTARPHLERWIRTVREREAAKKILVLPLR